MNPVLTDICPLTEREDHLYDLAYNKGYNRAIAELQEGVNSILASKVHLGQCKLTNVRLAYQKYRETIQTSTTTPATPPLPPGNTLVKPRSVKEVKKMVQEVCEKEEIPVHERGVFKPFIRDLCTSKNIIQDVNKIINDHYGKQRHYYFNHKEDVVQIIDRNYTQLKELLKQDAFERSKEKEFVEQNNLKLNESMDTTNTPIVIHTGLSIY